MPVYRLLTNRTEVVIGAPISLEQIQDSLAIQVVVTGTGFITAVVNTMCSANGIDYFKIATTSMSGTTFTTEGFTIKDPWQYLRLDVISISGASATVNALMVV